MVVSVIGKSTLPCCNKMDPFDILDTPASLRNTSNPSKCFNGRIIFYVDESENVIYVHFETTFDHHLMQQVFENAAPEDDYFRMNARIQSQFAQVFLFASSVCHVMVLTDTGSTFDSSYLSLFRSLSSSREKCFLKYANKSAVGKQLFNQMGKELRLCAPKMIFLFERSDTIDNDDSRVEDLEMDMEDDLYSIFKGENLLSKNTCLFVLPKKLPFIHLTRKGEVELNPVKESIQHLISALHGAKNEEFAEPYIGFGKPLRYYSKEFIDTEMEAMNGCNKQKKHSLRRVIRKHVKEIFSTGQGSGDPTETGGKNKPARGLLVERRVWLEIFESMHELLLGQENKEILNPEYVSSPFVILLIFI